MTTEQPEAVSLAIIDWRRGKWLSAKGKYSREHTWLLAGGVKLRVSDSEAMVPEAYRDGIQLNTEKASGILSELGSDIHWVSEVILNPRITYNEAPRATASAEARLHKLRQDEGGVYERRLVL